MPTIVGILTFKSRINFSFSLAEHEKSFITSEPGLLHGLSHETVSKMLQNICGFCNSVIMSYDVNPDSSCNYRDRMTRKRHVDERGAGWRT